MWNLKHFQTRNPTTSQIEKALAKKSTNKYTTSTTHYNKKFYLNHNEMAHNG